MGAPSLMSLDVLSLAPPPKKRCSNQQGSVGQCPLVHSLPLHAVVEEMGLEGAELTSEAPEPAVAGMTELVSSGSGWDCLGGFGEITVIVSLLQPRPQGSCCQKPWWNSRALQS